MISSDLYFFFNGGLESKWSISVSVLETASVNFSLLSVDFFMERQVPPLSRLLPFSLINNKYYQMTCDVPCKILLTSKGEFL